MNVSAMRRLAAGIILCASATLVPAWAGQAAPPAPSPPYVIPAGVPDYVRKAVQSPKRAEAQTARDYNRKPAEVLALSGVKPGDRVVEFAAFGQYFSDMLADILGPQGMLRMIDLPYLEGRTGAASRSFTEANPNTSYEVIDYNDVTLPQNLDVVFNILYYHDLSLQKIDTAKLNAKILAALKPGGVYFIVDHNAEPGSGTRDTERLHRIDPAIIRQQVQAAGFELVEESKLLAHAADDHTTMVFTPGVRGTTDQSVFKFRKPAR